jgi:hypothetical protein
VPLRSSISRNRDALCRKQISFLAAIEEGAEVTQKQTNARSNEYATASDFCHIYVEQMNSLYLLSLLLTADSRMAEQGFHSGFEDSMGNNFVFKERAYSWARRSIILHAIRLLRPRPSHESGSHEARLSPLKGKVPAELRAYPNFAGIVRLDSFERFVFIMSTLEMYSHQECSLLLGCFRRDVICARTAAILRLATTITTETKPERAVVAFAEGNYANR